MSAQINLIEGLAQSLIEFTRDPSSHEQSILQVINDLGTELLSNINEKNIGRQNKITKMHKFLFVNAKDIDIVCSVLFKDGGPIFGFILKCKQYSSGDIASAVAKSLQIMCTFIKERQHSFQKYANTLMVTKKKKKKKKEKIKN